MILKGTVLVDKKQHMTKYKTYTVIKLISYKSVKNTPEFICLW